MLAINCRRLGSCAMAPRCRLGSHAMTPRAYHRWGDALAVQHPLLSQIEKLIPDNQVICQSGKPHAFIRVAHAFLEGIAWSIVCSGGLSAADIAEIVTAANERVGDFDYLLAHMRNGSAQRSIGLTGESMPDRAEVNSAIVRCCTRVVPLRTVNERLNRDAMPDGAKPWASWRQSCSGLLGHRVNSSPPLPPASLPTHPGSSF
jgi:hypothetical protein